LITPAYLDATGNGFVQTECFDVRDESSRLLGVACIDTSVPSNALELSSTQKPLPLFIGSELQVSARGSQLQIGSGEVDRRLLDRAGIETEEEWRATASSLLRAKLTSAESHSLPFDRVQVLRFPNGAEIFAVPLALISRPEEAFTWRVLFFVFNPTTARYWPMAVAFIVLVIGMVAGLVVALWRYARERTQREDAILRNLRVGVIQSDANYYILRGNDRAEEILRCKIATFGADSHYAVDPPNLLSIIEHTVLVPPNDYPDSTWSLAQLSDIAKLRLRGLSSRYYARLVRPDSLQRRAGEWIEIQGTPFFDPTPAGQRQVETFGVINSLPFPLRRFLSVIERQLRERATK
jgi:PAS domain-containing protein